MYLLRNVDLANDHIYLFFIGLMVCGFVWGLSSRFLPGYSLPFYFFVLSAFTCMVDLVLSFTALNVFQLTWGNFYLNHGEEYLRDTHGAWINLWDGTVHYLCYLFFTYCFITKSTNSSFFHYVTLWWSGSVVNSLFVLIPGIFLGRYAPIVKLSILLNVPYVLFPLYIAYQQYTKGNPSGKSSPTIALFSRPWNYVIGTLYSMFAFGMLFRMIVALGSQGSYFVAYGKIETYLKDTSTFPLMQQLLYGYYFVPLFLVMGYYFSTNRNLSWSFLNLFIFFMGGLAQGQFAYLGGWLIQCLESCGYNPSWVKPSYEGTEFWLTFVWNTGLFILPQIITYTLYKNATA